MTIIKKDDFKILVGILMCRHSIHDVRKLKFIWFEYHISLNNFSNTVNKEEHHTFVVKSFGFLINEFYGKR